MALDLCSTTGGNTGGPNCDNPLGVPGIMVVGGKEFTSSEYADADTFQAALVAATKLPTGNSGKLYPFPVINDTTPNTEADTTGSLAQGPIVRLKKGRPSYTFICQDLGLQRFQSLLAFDNKVVPAFIFDDFNQFSGYRAAAATNSLNTKVFKGQRVLVTISGYGYKDGKAVETGQTRVNISYYSVDDFEKRMAFIALPNLSSGDLEGLKDVTLVEPDAHVSNVHSLVPYILTSQLDKSLDIGVEHGTALAALTWTAFTGATYGTSLTITSVAYTAGKLVFTFDSTAYTALSAGAKIKLVPPTAAVLDAADITGIEIGYIILTK